MKTTNRTPTADQIALSILLDTKLTRAQAEKKLSRFANELSAHAKGEVECPECGDKGPHDHNGDRLDPQFCCSACGMHFNDPGVAMP